MAATPAGRADRQILRGLWKFRGFGSGQHAWSSRDTVEDLQHRSFGIKDWVDRRLVQPGNAFTQIWLDKAGRPEASIDIRIERASSVHRSLGRLVSDGIPVPDHLQAVLRYRVGQTPNDMRQITDVIVLAQTHRGCSKQSLRFRCPGCSRRVADLYPDGHYFRCWKCCGVGYQSQRETPKPRGLAKAARIKQRLCGTGERPKGMHWRTYERLLKQLVEVEAQFGRAGINRSMFRLVKSSTSRPATAALLFPPAPPGQ